MNIIRRLFLYLCVVVSILLVAEMAAFAARDGFNGEGGGADFRRHGHEVNGGSRAANVGTHRVNAQTVTSHSHPNHTAMHSVSSAAATAGFHHYANTANVNTNVVHSHPNHTAIHSVSSATATTGFHHYANTANVNTNTVRSRNNLNASTGWNNTGNWNRWNNGGWNNGGWRGGWGGYNNYSYGNGWNNWNGYWNNPLAFFGVVALLSPFWYFYPYYNYGYYVNYPYASYYHPSYQTTVYHPTRSTATTNNKNVLPSNLAWAPVINGAIPDNAVTSTNKSGNTIYPCRAMYNNKYQYGSFVPNDGCYVVVNDTATIRFSSNYDALVTK